MSALSTAAIRKRLEETDLSKQLIVRPLLDQAAQLKDGQASIDVRLGFDFSLVTASSFGSISEFSDEHIQSESFANIYRREYVPFGAKLVIHPHQFVLAQTLEYLRLPSDLMSYVVGRSTWGRLGLIVATAVGIHPGFAGCLTLELRNLGEAPLNLYPGQTIAQLFFHHVVDGPNAPSTALPARMQYTGARNMIPKRISSGSSYEKLDKLRDRFRKLSET